MSAPLTTTTCEYRRISELRAKEKTRNARRRRPRADYMGNSKSQSPQSVRFGHDNQTIVKRHPAYTCRAQNSTIPQVGMKQTTRARTEYSAFPTGRMAASSRTNSTPAHDTQTTSHTHILVHRAQNKDVSTNTGIHSQSFSDRRMRLLHEFRINKEVARRPI